MWSKFSKHKIRFFPLFLEGKEHHAKYNVGQQARNKINSCQLHLGELGLDTRSEPSRSWSPEGGWKRPTVLSYHWTHNPAMNPPKKHLYFIFLFEKQHISVFSNSYPPRKKKKIKIILIPAHRENNCKHHGLYNLSVLKFNVIHSLVSLNLFFPDYRSFPEESF